MGSAAPPPPPSLNQKGVRRMLIIFAALAVIGIVTLAFSRALGLVLLIVAEGFFVVAYRRFSKVSKPKS
ncbi:MAG: hypothetical protein ACRD6W_18710 [Nitrososphaerales archaeon]